MNTKELYKSKGVIDYHTGGGCYAGHIQGVGGKEGLYALITDREDCTLSYTEKTVEIGIYDDRTGFPMTNDLILCKLEDAPDLAIKILKDFVEECWE